MPITDPKRDLLLTGIKHGFHILDASQITAPVEMTNYRSATNPGVRDKVERQIVEEILNNRYEIVFRKPSIISAIGAIPKKNSTKVRIIHDCSRPVGKALNDLAIHNPFHYQSLQDAVDIITPGAYMAKVDLAMAYRSVRTHPSNHAATGIKWNFRNSGVDTYMVDKRLPFGAKRSPEIFNELSQAVRRIMSSKGFPGIVVYLDDFLVIAKNKHDCHVALTTLMSLLRKLGFAINYGKVEGPTQRLVFLGIVLDTVQMTLELPDDKMHEFRLQLINIRNKSKVCKRQLQSLLGKLNWATQVIIGGRTFLRKIIDAITALKAPWHRTRITRDLRQDIDWWLNFMHVFNGRMPMMDNRPITPVYIDACSVAAGAYHNGDMVYTPWASWPGSEDLHINHKEALTLETAVCHWAPRWTNKKIHVFCDNQCAVSVINKGRSKDPFVMQSLRRIFWWSALFNFHISASYVPGQYNNLADAISRLHEPNGHIRLSHILSALY